MLLKDVRTDCSSCPLMEVKRREKMRERQRESEEERQRETESERERER